MKINDYSITIKNKNDLFSISSSKTSDKSDLLYHDEVEDYLIKTIDSL